VSRRDVHFSLGQHPRVDQDTVDRLSISTCVFRRTMVTDQNALTGGRLIGREGECVDGCAGIAFFPSPSVCSNGYKHSQLICHRWPPWRRQSTTEHPRSARPTGSPAHSPDARCWLPSPTIFSSLQGAVVALIVLQTHSSFHGDFSLLLGDVHQGRTACPLLCRWLAKRLCAWEFPRRLALWLGRSPKRNQVVKDWWSASLL